jgi:hypothetical protein
MLKERLLPLNLGSGTQSSISFQAGCPGEILQQTLCMGYYFVRICRLFLHIATMINLFNFSRRNYETLCSGHRL